MPSGSHRRWALWLALVVAAVAVGCSSTPGYEGASTSTTRPRSSPFEDVDHSTIIEQETSFLREARKGGLDTAAPQLVEVAGLFPSENEARDFAASIGNAAKNVEVAPAEDGDDASGRTGTPWRASAQRAMTLTPEHVVDWVIEFGCLVRDAGGTPGRGWESRGKAS